MGMPRAEIEAMFWAADMNSNGALDFEEFQALYWNQVEMAKHQSRNDGSSDDENRRRGRGSGSDSDRRRDRSGDSDRRRDRSGDREQQEREAMDFWNRYSKNDTIDMQSFM